ncbi:hypothetical protein Tco_0867725, partial [Tanacetum coccineum]
MGLPAWFCPLGEWVSGGVSGFCRDLQGRRKGTGTNGVKGLRTNGVK